MVLCVLDVDTKVVIIFDFALSFFLCDHRIDPGRYCVPDSMVASPGVVIINKACNSTP